MMLEIEEIEFEIVDLSQEKEGIVFTDFENKDEGIEEDFEDEPV